MLLDAMKCFGGDRNRNRRNHCKIVFLDDTELIQDVQTTMLGQELLDVVYKHLNLLETAYFGLRYLDATNQTHWLDPNKKIANQLKGTDPFTLYFAVKFYASDPCKLLEEITRYQFFLQIKQDVLQGRLPVPFDLAAELGALSVQSELGDYDPRRHQPGYVAEFCFAAHQTLELENHVAELHKTFIGQVPAVAELNFLEKVKWLDMYGVDLHPVLGEDNIEYFLGLTPSGVIVLRNKNKVGNYFWPRITKVYFKGKYFMLRVRDKSSDESTYGFELPSKQACKHLWKCCVEHHAFFRLTQVNTKNAGKVFSFTSRFRHSGRTERQVHSDLQQQNRLQPRVIRVASRRYPRRVGEPDGIDSSLKDTSKENEKLETQSNLSIPQPLHLSHSIHRTSSMPNTLGVSDSPRSTRSAPWEDPRQRGLFSNSTNPSPRSVRSAGWKPSRHHHRHHHHHHHHRTSSVDSEDSNDGRRKRHHQHSRNHRSRRVSDNGSEVSHSSKHNQSHLSSRNHRSGSRHRENSGSESEVSHKHRHRSRRNRQGSNYVLVNTEAQWQQVQNQQKVRHQAQAEQSIHSSAPKRNSGYVNSGMESDSETNHLHRRRHRKHRSRSRSPSETHKKPPIELKKHFEYGLVDSNGMSVDQLRDIPYTKVETDSKVFKVRYSPNSNRKQHRSTISPRSSRHLKCNAPSDRNEPLQRSEDEYHNERNDHCEDSVSLPPYAPMSVKETKTAPAVTSSPASSTRSLTATDGRHEGYRRSFDLLANHYQTRNSSSSSSINGQSTQRNQLPNGGGGEVLNAYTTNHEHSDSGLGTEGHDNYHHTNCGPPSSGSYRSSPNHSNGSAVTMSSSNTSSTGARYIMPPVPSNSELINRSFSSNIHQHSAVRPVHNSHGRPSVPITYQQQAQFGQQQLSSTSTLPQRMNGGCAPSRGQFGPKPMNLMNTGSLNRTISHHQQQLQHHNSPQHAEQQFVHFNDGPSPSTCHVVPMVPQKMYLNSSGHSFHAATTSTHASNGSGQIPPISFGNHQVNTSGLPSSHMAAYHTNNLGSNYNGWMHKKSIGVSSALNSDACTNVSKTVNGTQSMNTRNLEHGHEMSTEL